MTNYPEKLRDWVTPPAPSADVIWSVYNQCLQDLMWFSVRHGALWMLRDQSEIDDYLQESYLVTKRVPGYLTRWSGASTLSGWVLHNLEWMRGRIFDSWKWNRSPHTTMLSGTTTTTCIDPGVISTWSPATNRPDTTSANPIGNWSAFSSSIGSNDSTYWQFDWNLDRQSYRAMMPDDRYRTVFDGLCQDKYQIEIAKEMDTAKEVIHGIAEQVENLCSGRDWKFIRPTPGRRGNKGGPGGYTEHSKSGQRNVVGKVIRTGRPS